MFHEHKEEISAAITLLQQAEEKANSILYSENLSPLRQQVSAGLKKIVQSLSLNLGISNPATDEDNGPKKVTKFMGRELGKKETKVAVSPEPVLIEESAGDGHDGLSPEAKELADKVAKVYPEFNSLSNDEILDSLSDLEIRGVAKKAGLPVTETKPKKLDHKYIDLIKSSIVEKANQEAIAAEAAGSKNDKE